MKKISFQMNEVDDCYSLYIFVTRESSYSGGDDITDQKSIGGTLKSIALNLRTQDPRIREAFRKWASEENNINTAMIKEFLDYA